MSLFDTIISLAHVQLLQRLPAQQSAQLPSPACPALSWRPSETIQPWLMSLPAHLPALTFVTVTLLDILLCIEPCVSACGSTSNQYITCMCVSVCVCVCVCVCMCVSKLKKGTVIPDE